MGLSLFIIGINCKIKFDFIPFYLKLLNINNVELKFFQLFKQQKTSKEKL